MPDDPQPLTPRTEQALRALGIGPLAESDTTSPVDLRTVPRDQWPQHHCCPLVLPPDVARYLAGMDAPPTRSESKGIEDRVQSFYGITEPFLVVWKNGEARLIYDHPSA
jgi:hypothetical protein